MKKGNKSTIENEIKKALIDVGVTQADIARERGVSRQYVHKVIKGQRRTAHIRKAIARRARKRVEELWPSGPIQKAA